MSRYEYEPLSGALREAQDEEDEEEHVLKENEASDDELEAEYQEAVAMLTIAKQRQTEVGRAGEFFPCAKRGQLGHWKDDNECPAKVKVVENGAA